MIKDRKSYYLWTKYRLLFFSFFFKRNWRHQEMYIILKDIKRLMTKLIQTIES